MIVTQHTIDVDGVISPPADGAPDLVLLFANRRRSEAPDFLSAARAAWPGAVLAGCTTAGQIQDVGIVDEHAVVTTLTFSSAKVRVFSEVLADAEDSFEVGAALADAVLQHGPPRAVLVFSEGLVVNGSALVRGLSSRLPPESLIAGGLSGDDADFERTAVIVDGAWRGRAVVAVGFWGESLRAGCGSLGGWEPFGPERLITRAAGNVLYSLDQEPALDLYRRYLGEWASQLPAAGLRFPLAVRTPDGRRFVRTVLGIDERDGSMNFAGDLPQGAVARLMMANLERLIDGAEGAAGQSVAEAGADADFALLVSCVGRRMVLRARTEDELEAVRSVLGPRPVIAGFYSYGELAPFAPGCSSELHNQTMTLLLLGEG